MTRPGVQRIIRYAFRLAQSRPRKLLTVVTKSNAQRHAMVMWDEIAAEVAREFPDVTWDKMLVDAMTMRMVMKPQSLDTIVATNLHADILSDLASELSGSLGLAGSIMAGDTLCCAQAQHGSAPDIAGKGVANPLAACLTLALLLDHLHEDAAAARLRAAVEHVVRAGEVTPDLGGRCTTTQSTDAVLRALEGGHGLAPRDPEDGRAR